jgi:methyltransferase (TIGR00027 family)
MKGKNMTKKKIAELLSSTAFWTASVRALESRRPDCLFNDPWAAALASETGAAWIEQRNEFSVIPIVLRTRYFDDFLQRITRQETIRQIVMPAAGLDTRAYRLDWPEGTHFFEIDQPMVLDHKEQILDLAQAKPKCLRHTISLDLTGNWKGALVQVGFNPQMPSVWLLEGFLFYLPNESITSIIDQVTSLAAPGSWMGFDIINRVMLTHQLSKQWVEMQAAAGAPWVGTMDDPIDFLASRGWEASLSQAGADDANHGRWPYPVIPITMADLPHNWYVTAMRVS